MRVVDATQADVVPIARLWEAGWFDAHERLVPAALAALRTPDSFENRARKALPGTRLVRGPTGLLGFCMTREDELYQLYVGPEARGTGVAGHLIADAEARIKAAGYKTAWLACAIGNARAEHFYTRSGWRNAGRETVLLDTDGDGYPLEVWRFEKPLTA